MSVGRREKPEQEGATGVDYRDGWLFKITYLNVSGNVKNNMVVAVPSAASIELAIKLFRKEYGDLIVLEIESVGHIGICYSGEDR